MAGVLLRGAWNAFAQRMKCAALTCGMPIVRFSHWEIAMTPVVNVLQVRCAAKLTSLPTAPTIFVQIVSVPVTTPVAQ